MGTVGPGTIAAGTIGVTRRPRTIGPVTARPVAILAETFSARRVRSLLAGAILARAKILVGFTIWPVTTPGSIPFEPRPVAFGAPRRCVVARTKIVARFMIGPITTPRGIPVEPRSVTLAPTRRGAIALAKWAAFTVAGKGALFAIALPGKILASEAALGELLFRASGSAGTALAARRPVTPAATGIVVFIVVAGHEQSH
jgi:hypothetical protein